MIQRKAQEKLIQLSQSFKIVAVIGPRQSGKTTLVKATFPYKTYVSLENLDNRAFAEEDPRGFLETYQKGAIFDEIQRVPKLFSYLQEILDNSTEKGLFILTGSNNFLLQENISQTLAGRLGYLSLLPFSYEELNIDDKTDNQWMFDGFYPPVYDQEISPTDWYSNYIKTYLERDVRQIKNINNLLVFDKFLRILAGRTGQELNMTAIGNEVGVSTKTIQSWIGILVSSFIIYLLRPYYNNYKKTIVKRPKIYFYDTGVVCSLLRIQNNEQLENYPLRGAIFETMVISETIKAYTNKGIEPPLYYWRDKTGHEVDLIIDDFDDKKAIEIKSGKTILSEWFKKLNYWKKLTSIEKSYIIYAGNQEQNRSNLTKITNWKKIKSVINKQ